MRMINIGLGNLISSSRLIAVIGPDSAPVKRMIQEARDSGHIIDGTVGRRTRAVMIMDSGHVVLSALQPETIANRLQNESEGEKQ
jgi:extracellular matrix regulatory protein A